jgi:hypothetical protein
MPTSSGIVNSEMIAELLIAELLIAELLIKFPAPGNAASIDYIAGSHAS